MKGAPSLSLRATAKRPPGTWMKSRSDRSRRNWPIFANCRTAGTILASIEEQGKLTPELKAHLEATLEKTELEDLYLPYKPKRRTKATIAREKGLEPLALYLWEQQRTGAPLSVYAGTFGAGSVDEALEGARHIVAEMISENADFRK